MKPGILGLEETSWADDGKNICTNSGTQSKKLNNFISEYIMESNKQNQMK